MLPARRAAVRPGRTCRDVAVGGGCARGFKVLCALYPDPHAGYPPPSVRDSLPRVTHYANGATTPSPKDVDFAPGSLLGSVSGALGLRRFLASKGAEYVVTSDKDGAGCELERHLHDADVVISQVWSAGRARHTSRRSVAPVARSRRAPAPAVPSTRDASPSGRRT